jgi:hypothetical protein
MRGNFGNVKKKKTEKEIHIKFYEIMTRSLDSAVFMTTGWTTERSEFESRWRLAPGPTQPPIYWVPGLFPQE